MTAVWQSGSRLRDFFVRMVLVIASGSREMQKPLAQVGEEPDDFLVVGRDEDTGPAPLRPHFFLGHQLDLHAIPRPFDVAVGLPVDGDGGVDGVADELPEGHAEAIPIEDAVLVGLAKFLGVT